jgi:hypothetical protein
MQIEGQLSVMYFEIFSVERQQVFVGRQKIVVARQMLVENDFYYPFINYIKSV